MADKDNKPVPAQIFLQTGPEENHSAEDGHGLDLSIVFDYVDMIRGRLWLFIAIPVLFLSVAFFRIYTATPIYESTCQLQIQHRPMNVSGFQSVYDPLAGMRDLDQHVNTEIQLMQTPEVLNQAIAELNLDATASFETGNPVGTLARNLRISKQANTFLINVAYRSPDAAQAARIANFLGDLYVRRYQERRHEVSGGGMSRLREQLEKIAVARDEALQDLTGFKRQHGIMDMDYERELFSQRISALTQVLIDAEMTERQAQEAVSTIEAWKAEGHLGAIVHISDNRFAQTFRMEQLRMQMELPAILSKFGQGHSEVRTKQQIIGNLENAVANEIETSLVSLRLKQQRAARRREIIEQAIAGLENQMMDLDSLGAHYYRLQDTYKATENAYRKVISRINDINISIHTDELDANDFLRVARRAEPRSTPVWPNRRETLARAGFLGLAAGAGLCILLGMLDPSVKHKAEIDRCLKGATVLGSVPSRPDGQGELVAAEDAQSVQAEAFRSIRTSLSLCLAGRKERCFAVTSSGPGDGKTTVALNLAIALAKDGKKVLLMECDMRRPRFQKVFGNSVDIADCKGVSQLLVGDDKLRDAVTPFKQQEGLDVVLCGPVPPNPGELLGTERFDNLLQEAKEQYDYVIIDSPPLLNVADAAILAGHNVPLLFVVRLFRTTRHDLRMAYERIQTIQAKCTGLIINQAEVPKHSGYGYYRYGHYRHYTDGYAYGHGNNGSGKRRKTGRKPEPVSEQRG